MRPCRYSCVLASDPWARREREPSHHECNAAVRRRGHDAGRYAERSCVNATAEEDRSRDHQPRGRGPQPAATALEADEHDQDDAEAMEELEVHGRLEAAQRLRVRERK